MKLIFKLIRAILGPLVLFLERLTNPRPRSRSPEVQARVDSETSRMALYQFETCPFCLKVRRAMKRLGLQIELRDARREPKFKEELVREGGQLQVPCLKILDGSGKARWMYESSDIIAYLEERFAK